MLDYEIDLICICIVLGIMRQTFKRQDVRARLLCAICLVLFLICSFETIYTVAIQYELRRLMELAVAFMLPLFCVLAYVWFTYVFYLLCPQYSLRGSVFDLLCRSLLSLYLVFSLSSPWHQFLFYFQPDSKILQGNLLWTVVAIPCVFGVLCIMMCLKDLYDGHHQPLKNNLGILCLTLGGMGAGYEQYLTNLPLVCPFVTFGLLIYFISLQNLWISKDPLTRLNNRASLSYFMKHSFPNLSRHYLTYLVYLDINRFKKINDNYGHVAGDLALKLLAEVLMLKAEHTRHFLCRLGGDEFVAVLMVNRDEEVTDFVLGIREQLKLRAQQAQLPFSISISVGVSHVAGDGSNYAEAMEIAESEMYSDKQYGANFI